tara:strand:+ start:165 stop:320 length:156 start_codon:yes stop_codon:yes gene_type:complete
MNRMIVTRETLVLIKDIIEQNVKIDPSLTDVIITYQLKEADNKNYLNVSIK